jgi:Ca2+-transporting ATPase
LNPRALPKSFARDLLSNPPIRNISVASSLIFTTLMLLQMFNVLNARSDERSAFAHLFTNQWLWAALGVSLVLQVVVLYASSLQRAVGTVSLSGVDWLFCTAVASSVLWFREISKLLARAIRKV